MYVDAACRSMTNACVSMKTLLPLLLLLAAYMPADALQCYDCLSKALPECADGSRAKQFDTTTCHPDEIFCSVLLMNDSAGTQLISRQCASREDEGDQLMSFVAGSHDKPLKMVKFVICKNDLCNTENPGGKSHADSKLHGGGNSPGISGATSKPANGDSGTRLSATPFGILSMLVVCLTAAAVLRPYA